MEPLQRLPRLRILDVVDIGYNSSQWEAIWNASFLLQLQLRLPTLERVYITTQPLPYLFAAHPAKIRVRGWELASEKSFWKAVQVPISEFATPPIITS